MIHHVKKHYKKVIKAGVVLAVPFLALTNPSVMDKINPLGEYEAKIAGLSASVSESRDKITALEFDRIRLEDSTNILLAIQDFIREKDSLPESLFDLKKQKFLDVEARLADPETNYPYFYEKRSGSFILCIWLSDMVKGVNTIDCPELTR